MNNYKGKFITIEGMDGCGKGTQVEKLKEYFFGREDVVFLREPGGQIVSEDIRELILNNKYTDMDDLTEFLLFSASRAQLTKNVIIPLLKEGKTIICERYSDSSFAYQGCARGLDLLDVMTINKIATHNIQPDVTIYLKLSPEESFNRTKNRGELDRIENAGVKLQEKVYQGYELVSKLFKHRIVAVHAEMAPEEVFKEIINVLKTKNII